MSDSNVTKIQWTGKNLVEIESAFSPKFHTQEQLRVMTEKHGLIRYEIGDWVYEEDLY